MSKLMQYGVANTVYFNLYDVNGIDEYTSALVAGDAQISIDGAALSNVSPTYANGQYSFALSTANLTCKKIKVKLVDQTATAAFMAKDIEIVTFGDPSSEIPIPLGTDISSTSDLTDAIEALTTADADTWAEVMTYLGAFVANNITATGLRDRGNTKDRITASRTATTRTVTARDAT